MSDWRFGKNSTKVKIIQGVILLLIIVLVIIAGIFAMKGFKKIQAAAEVKKAEELKTAKKESLETMAAVLDEKDVFTKEEKKQIKKQYNSAEAGIEVAEEKSVVYEIRDDFLSYTESIKNPEDEGGDENNGESGNEGESEGGGIEEITPDQIQASLISISQADIGSYTKAGVVNASASSIIQQNNGVTNEPIKMFDGDDQTNWEEGVDGPGIGESVWADFDRNYKVKYITFKLGNWKSDKYYYGNNKPKTMTIELGGLQRQVTFPDSKEEFCVELDHAYEANYLKLTIDEVYQGTSWDDTVITDVSIYGN